MDLQAHFHDIQQVIINHLQDAEYEILVAVAWFTDRDIFEVLCEKAQEGVQVTVAVLGDEINQAPGALNFQHLMDLGGKVIFLPSGSNGAPMMHHKFCVLDTTTVITGSYNWSKKAQSNDENITLVTDASEFAAQYRQAFHTLIGSGSQASGSSVVVDVELIRRRLEMVRNLILLGEQEDLSPQIQKLRPMVQALRLGNLLQDLERGNYGHALETIEAYLQRSRSVVLRDDIDVPNLQFQLQVLELRLQSLTDEKSDIERNLVIFNRRFNDALGSLFIDLLETKATWARRRVEIIKQQEQDLEDAQIIEEEAEQAEQEWQDYQEEYDQQQTQEAPSQLSDDEEKELKHIYRQSCSLCHPDRFDEAQKADAHQAFVTLQAIYKSNDLPALRELHASLKSGGLSKVPRSATLSRADALRAAIAGLQHRISETVQQLQDLYQSEGAGLLRLAGDTEDQWLDFFEKQKQLLQAEIEQLQQAISLLDASETE